MKDVLKNIRISDKTILKGNLAKSYKGIVIISKLVKTEKLPADTILPILMWYKVGADQGWDAEMQANVCDFIVAKAGQGKVLICSDKGDSRAPATLIRILIKLGFLKKDAISIIKAKTGYQPKPKILTSFPDLDDTRPSRTLPGGTEATRKLGKNFFGLTDKELEKVR